MCFRFSKTDKIFVSQNSEVDDFLLRPYCYFCYVSTDNSVNERKDDHLSCKREYTSLMNIMCTEIAFHQIFSITPFLLRKMSQLQNIWMALEKILNKT
jgi:hypothetical protein